MSDFTIITIILLSLLSAFGAYGLGYWSGLKNVEIAKLKLELDIYEKRLASWNENQKNF